MPLTDSQRRAAEPRKMVRIALRTDSEREARAKAPGVGAELWAYWEALAAGPATTPKPVTRPQRRIA